jgi:glycosyltransferase involved in cell wall biosynthesis
LYGPPITKAEARSQLGITNSGKLFSYLGTARPGRNPAIATASFLENAASHDHLLIAGSNAYRFVPKDLDKRVKIYEGVIPVDLFHKILCASDFIINDGQHYLTSAIIRTAMSYSRPVIAYPFGSAVDMAKDAAVWISDSENGLADAIRTASMMSEPAWQALSAAAAKNETLFTWQQCGEACMALYQELLDLRD